MIVVPAIDIKDGACVRLVHGDPAQKTVYSTNPAEMAEKWASLGAQRLHVVDLDGAFAGHPVNDGAIRKIVKAVKMEVQVGGGLRDLAAVERVFEAGASRAILGTVLLEDPAWIKEAVKKFPGKLVAGLDVKHGEVMVKGWKAGSGLSLPEVLHRVESMGFAELIFTDITKDGTLEGPNIQAIRDVLGRTCMAVFSSAGVSCLKDIESLKTLEAEGLKGCIVGKALYDGRLELRDALKVSGN
jgi:phosphoribosylformimino-5-aminoimidazole carboxamide ribotide isomerase